MWFFLALASTFLYSFRRLSEKRLSENLNHFVLGFAVQAFSLPGIALLLFFAPIPNLFSLSINFWYPLLIIWLFLYPLQAYFYYKSLKSGEISFVLPLMSFIPIFNIISTWWLIGEIPSFMGFVGILAIVVGIYSLNIRPNTHLISPITHLFRDKPSMFMLINCACLAFGATLDKIAIKASNPLFYTFVNTLGASIILLIIAKLTTKQIFYPVQKNYKSLGYIGVFQSVAFTCYIVALNTGIVPYVLAIKSSSAILGSIWGFIFLKESMSKYKLIALSFISLGIILIALG